MTEPDSARSGSLREARATLAAARELAATARRLRTRPDDLRGLARLEHDRLLTEVVVRQLHATGLDALRRVAGRNLRQKALADGGYDNVLAILRASPPELQQLPGVGPQTAAAVWQAALEVRAAVEREAVFRFDPDRPDPGQERLLRALRGLDAATTLGAAVGPVADRLADDLDRASAAAGPAGSRFRTLFSTRRGRAAARAALVLARELLDAPDAETVRSVDRQITVAAQHPDPGALWTDFERRAATYQTLLAEVRGAGPESESEASKGYVSVEVADEADLVRLDTSLLRVRLRAYQAFGARYALARRRSMIGDEMGLGKTVEALAVAAHLSASGRRSCLVVCPASVLINWADEVGRHSALSTYQLHGADRQRELTRWLRDGGVAITTFDTLGRLGLPDGARPDLLVVDEAHMVKNRQARRSQAVAELARRADRVLFLTGTPMENRVAEFRDLVSYLDPELAGTLKLSDTVVGAEAFRRRVAPVYLRRNQTDVPKELPELLELDDWVTLGPAQQRAYADAVYRRHFPDMRRAAYLADRPGEAGKLDRLLEIVEESAANGWKVVVFSYFRDVLDSVHNALGAASTLLTGDVPAARRQELIAGFSARKGHAVLVSQIQAGGVGLNIQAASVVLLAEPQLKPSIEEQAIRRCYRMGQTRMVRVHRLLAKDTVDERIQDLLWHKRQLFQAYAHDSDAKRVDAAALDSTYLPAEAGQEPRIEPNALVDAEWHRLGLR